MKRLLNWIGLRLHWLVYLWATSEERHLYSMGKIQGMHCKGYKKDGFLIADAARVYEYDPNKEPERDYLTWAEFKEKKPRKDCGPKDADHNFDYDSPQYYKGMKHYNCKDCNTFTIYEQDGTQCSFDTTITS